MRILCLISLSFEVLLFRNERAHSFRGRVHIVQSPKGMIESTRGSPMFPHSPCGSARIIGEVLILSPAIAHQCIACEFAIATRSILSVIVAPEEPVVVIAVVAAVIV